MPASAEPQGTSLRLNREESLAAQQLAEADPAGWGIVWDAWPAGVRENEGRMPASAGQLSSRPLGGVSLASDARL